MRYSIGDKVWTAKDGHGVVLTIGRVFLMSDKRYPVIVEFDDGKKESFTSDGKADVYDKHPTLYFKEVSDDDELLKRPMDELIHGHVYEVWDDAEKKSVCLRYYNEVTKKFVTYKNVLGRDDWGIEHAYWRKIN
jgi:hypothetical protein